MFFPHVVFDMNLERNLKPLADQEQGNEFSVVTKPEQRSQTAGRFRTVERNPIFDRDRIP